MKRVLITGSSGRIGSAIAAALQARLDPDRTLRYEVLGLDWKAGPLTDIIADISSELSADQARLDQAMHKVDAVIHAAAYHAPHVGSVDDETFKRVNVEGTCHLLDAARIAGVRRFVYTSSTSVYGAAMLPHEEAVWVDEDLQPQPRDIYDVTKLAAEGACRQAFQDGQNAGLQTIVLRMSRCFPEPEEVMANYRLYRGVDARDVVQAHELALHAPLPRFEIVNVSAESCFQRADCAALWQSADQVIQRYYPWAAQAYADRHWTLPQKIDRVYDVARAKALLGYRPEYNFYALFEK